MNIALSWQGPVGPGRFPDDPHDLQALLEPGVYLRVKCYDRGRTVSYVGQSINLLARFDQHLTSLLGLLYPLRDDGGRPAFGGDLAERLAAFNDLDRAAALAAAEAKRMRFYYAPCGEGFDLEHLSLVESALKTRIERNVVASAADLDCENRQGISPGAIAEEIVIESDLTALSEADQGLVAGILGGEPIRVPVDDRLAIAFDA